MCRCIPKPFQLPWLTWLLRVFKGLYCCSPQHVGAVSKSVRLSGSCQTSAYQHRILTPLAPRWVLAKGFHVLQNACHRQQCRLQAQILLPQLMQCTVSEFLKLWNVECSKLGCNESIGLGMSRCAAGFLTVRVSRMQSRAHNICCQIAI